MGNIDFDLLRATLEAKLTTITTAPDRRPKIVIQQSPDSLDQTQFAAERDLVVSLLNRETQMYRQVRGALRRIEDSTYGICLACEDPISPKRLAVVPWADLCRDCQERSDLSARGVLRNDQDEAAGLKAA